MAVVNKTTTAEEKEVEQVNQKSREEAVGNDLLDRLGLTDDPPEEEEKPQKKEPEEVEEDDEEEEEQASDEEEDDEEEDYVPVSKLKKRVNAEKARNRILEAQLQEAKSKLDQSSKTDSRRAKLEAMSPEELKSLKVNAKTELRELIRTGSDANRENQLDELVDEIDDVIHSAPTRFSRKQVDLYNRAVNEVMTDPKNDKIDFDKHSGKIKELASDLYTRYPELQKLETGQATALKMAVDHFREIGSSVKEKDNKLRQENKKLKRKTALDSSVARKGMETKGDFRKKRESLRTNPSILKREEFVESLLDIDKYLPQHLKG